MGSNRERQSQQKWLRQVTNGTKIHLFPLKIGSKQGPRAMLVWISWKMAGALLCQSQKCYFHSDQYLRTLHLVRTFNLGTFLFELKKNIMKWLSSLFSWVCVQFLGPLCTFTTNFLYKETTLCFSTFCTNIGWFRNELDVI